MSYILRKVSDGAYHISESANPSSMLTRYGIIRTEYAPLTDTDPISVLDSLVALDCKRRLEVGVTKYAKDYVLEIPLSKGERLFGCGDSNRDNVMIRGSRLVLQVANIRSYGPMPILLSSDGWAIVLNTTYSSVFDCGATDPDKLTVRVLGGEVDFYLFRADTLAALIERVTLVTGRPMMLPKFAYGLQFIMNQNANQHDLLETARLFREKDIPCDSIGLEPDWMEKHYDFSTEKKWNTEKFPLIRWQGPNQSGRGTMFYPLRRMGVQLSLWLCEDYDLIYHEENIAPAIEEPQEFPEDAEILDPHLVASVWMDKITKQDERWFEHLKKFVDNGASAFKLDGSNQVLAHPDRLWGGKYLDEEVHNVYPVLLAKEMQEGFNEYTGRRALINTSGAFVGTQKYAATWAGDTGGGPRTLVSVMNYAMCGHSNTSCDIDIHTPESMHYGFLMPWTQHNSWDYHYLPWYMGDELCTRYTFYARLRSTLFPYVYSAAHVAATCGLPVIRPLSLVNEGTDRYDGVKNAYMLGESLYVGAFDMHLTLPEGRWIDYFNGDVYEGNTEIDYKIPEGLGGALFVRSGDIIVTMKHQKYILEREHDYVINLYPDTRASCCTLYEDDGYTFDYKDGGYATTLITSSGIVDSCLTLTVDERKGGWQGRPDNGHNILDNSIPEIRPMSPLRDMTVRIHGAAPKSVILDGVTVETRSADGCLEFTVPASRHTSGSLSYVLNF